MRPEIKTTTTSYNYTLPDEAIAINPVAPRDHSKLLLYKEGNIQEDVFYSLEKHLETDDCLVVNNTKVIPARLKFSKDTGACIEVLCLEPAHHVSYETSLQSSTEAIWNCMVGNLKKWKEGAINLTFQWEGKEYVLTAVLAETEGKVPVVHFKWDAPCNFYQLLEVAGHTPLPPYLNREADAEDRINYQTYYSKNEGSVAAPTAGLHFTPEVLHNLQEKGIQMEELTLHVGAGTFTPVKAEHIQDHQMHQEYFEVDRKTLENLSDTRRNIVAVGTTSMRTLESLYWIGVRFIIEKDFSFREMIRLDQWEAYDLLDHVEYEKAFDAVLAYLHINKLDRFRAQTRLMITPGYHFNVVQKLITNFHQPKSTLLMLVSAFIGEDWRKVYQYAHEHNFRFLSYGDSSLLIPKQ